MPYALMCLVCWAACYVGFRIYWKGFSRANTAAR